MVTKNLKSIIGTCFTMVRPGTHTFGVMPIVGVTGKKRYLSNTNYHNATGNWGTFPISIITDLTLDPNARGISVGTGGTAATEDDYQLEHTITSGITMAMAEMEGGSSTLSCPFITYKITVANTGSDPITIREIGYKQCARTVLAQVADATTDETICLLDRTVLDVPLTIQAGDAGMIYYKISTITRQPKTVAGVEIVPWESGTDEQIAAMIDAARLGTIDLQTDAGWEVGDVRVVNIGEWTGGGNIIHPATQIALVISSFEEYEGCGNIMQFDYANLGTVGSRFNATATNAGGYGASEMKTVTIPALVEAFPSWLSSRLLTFNVKSSIGSKSSTIETVTGNKLALRSEVEITGSATVSAPGEGTQVDLYTIADNRPKTDALTTTRGYIYFLRSPRIDASNSFVTVTAGGAIGSVSASSQNYFAVFGCL